MEIIWLEPEPGPAASIIQSPDSVFTFVSVHVFLSSLLTPDLRWSPLRENLLMHKNQVEGEPMSCNNHGITILHSRPTHERTLASPHVTRYLERTRGWCDTDQGRAGHRTRHSGSCCCHEWRQTFTRELVPWFRLEILVKRKGRGRTWEQCLIKPQPLIFTPGPSRIKCNLSTDVVGVTLVTQWPAGSDGPHHQLSLWQEWRRWRGVTAHFDSRHSPSPNQPPPQQRPANSPVCSVAIPYQL